jgi:hypothetical protein
VPGLQVQKNNELGDESPGSFALAARNYLVRVRVTSTAVAQNDPVTVTVCVAGSKDDVRSTLQVPDAPARAQVKLPLCVCVCSPTGTPFTMLSLLSKAVFGLRMTERLLRQAGFEQVTV